MPASISASTSASSGGLCKLRISSSSASSRGAMFAPLYLASDSPGSTENASAPPLDSGRSTRDSAACGGASTGLGPRGPSNLLSPDLDSPGLFSPDLDSLEAYFDSGNPRPRLRRRRDRPRRSRPSSSERFGATKGAVASPGSPLGGTSDSVRARGSSSRETSRKFAGGLLSLSRRESSRRGS